MAAYTIAKIARIRSFLDKASQPRQQGYWCVLGIDKATGRTRYEYRGLSLHRAIQRMNRYIKLGYRPHLAWQSLAHLSNDGLLTGAEVHHA
jgi:hypothetical protein